MAVTDTAAREAGRLIGCRALFGSDVALSQPFPGRPPLWIEPVDPALRRDIGAAVRWMDSHHADIEDALIAFGAIVWRGFPVSGPDGFAALMGRFTPYAQGYTAGTTDRQAIKGQSQNDVERRIERSLPLELRYTRQPIQLLPELRYQNPSTNRRVTGRDDNVAFSQMLPGDVIHRM